MVLAATLCLGQAAGVSAASVSANDVAVEEGEQADDSLDDSSAQVQQTDAAGSETEQIDAGSAAGSETEQIDADSTAGLIYPNGAYKTEYPLGKDAELEFCVSPEASYTVCVIDADGKTKQIAAETAASGTASTVVEKVELNFAKLPAGDYEIRYWLGSYEDQASAQVSRFTIKIRKSIVAQDNASLKELTVANAAYTGSNVTPVITIKEKKGDSEYTLVVNKDYKYEFVSENKKELGKAKIKITGIGDYMGEVEKEFDIVPGTPAIASATAISFSSVQIKWTKVACADGYYIDRKAGDGSFKNIGKVTGNGTLSFTDTSSELAVGQTYYYRVKAFAASKVDAKREVESVANETGVAVKVVPAAPKLVSAENVSYNKIKLTWQPVDGAKGYVVYRIEAGGTLKKLKTTTATSYTVSKDITCGKTYTYTVKAYAIAANSDEKVYSEYDRTGLKTMARPAAPKLVSAKAETDGSVCVRWKRVTKAYGYCVYRKEKGNPDSEWKKIKTVKYGDTTSAYDKKAEPGITYLYTVKAYTKVNGKKVYSTYDTKGKSCKVVPGRPKYEVRQSQSDQCVKISINTMKNVDGYFVYRKEGNGSYKRIATVKMDKNASVTVYADKNIAIGKSYTYYVKAFKYNEESRVAGKAGKKLSITVK